MLKRLSTGLLVGTLGFAAGCGSDDGEPEETDPNPVTNGDIIDHPKGFPFVVAAVAFSDLCGGPTTNACELAKHPPPEATTAILTQPEAGKICLAGSVAPGGYAVLVFSLVEFGGDAHADLTKVLKPFDADALGITQVAFTVDSPPSVGLYVGGTIITQLECPADYHECFDSGFTLMSASHAPLNITASGPVVAPFINFERSSGGGPFNTSMLHSFAFSVTRVPYDFCIHDFKFLDAAGEEVKP